MKVDKLKDFAERVGWTAIQAAAAAGLVALTTDNITWAVGGKMVAVAAALAALKVFVAQNVSPSGDGSAIPGGVVEPKP